MKQIYDFIAEYLKPLCFGYSWITPTKCKEKGKLVAGMRSQETAAPKAKEYCTLNGGQNPYVEVRFYDGN